MTGARLCHDMVNPLGAIANGLELLELSGIAEGPELDLIRASVHEASARLKFLRIAFGPGQPDLDACRDELVALAQKRFDGHSVSLAWQSHGFPSKAEAKAVFLGLIALEGVCARGGEIMVQGAPGDWRLSARSPRPLLNMDNWALLEPDAAPQDPAASLIHFAALRAHMALPERRVSATPTETGLELSLSF